MVLLTRKLFIGSTFSVGDEPENLSFDDKIRFFEEGRSQLLSVYKARVFDRNKPVF